LAFFPVVFAISGMRVVLPWLMYPALASALRMGVVSIARVCQTMCPGSAGSGVFRYTVQ